MVIVASISARVGHHGERGQNAVQFLQMATEAKPGGRLASESPRRGDFGDEGGHLLESEHTVQHSGSGPRSGHVPTGSQLQRQRGQWNHPGAYDHARTGAQVSKIIVSLTWHQLLLGSINRWLKVPQNVLNISRRSTVSFAVRSKNSTIELLSDPAIISSLRISSFRRTKNLAQKRKYKHCHARTDGYSDN